MLINLSDPKGAHTVENYDIDIIEDKHIGFNDWDSQFENLILGQREK